MFKYWKKMDQLNHINRLLVFFILILTLIVITLVITITTSPNRYEFWLSPNMSANGGLLKNKEVPDEYVQGFVATLIPSLYTWSNKGKEEFAKNMAGFKYYFTARHLQLLEQTLTHYQDAQLFNRSQVASLYRFMEPTDIKRIAPNAWDVRLLLRLTQRLNDNNAQVITDKVVEYHLRVIKVHLSRLQNPFQLSIDGYTQPEKRLHDLLAKTEEQNNDSF